MCEWRKWGDTRIDPCMRILITNLKKRSRFNIVACCCGHNKYQMTIIIKESNGGYLQFRDIVSDRIIPRIKRFYKRDEEGYYYIPEVEKEASNDSTKINKKGN